MNTPTRFGNVDRNWEIIIFSFLTFGNILSKRFVVFSLFSPDMKLSAFLIDCVNDAVLVISWMRETKHLFYAGSLAFTHFYKHTQHLIKNLVCTSKILKVDDVAAWIYCFIFISILTETNRNERKKGFECVFFVFFVMASLKCACSNIIAGHIVFGFARFRNVLLCSSRYIALLSCNGCRLYWFK